MRQTKFHDTGICDCGKPKAVTHRRCKSCRQKASRNQNAEEIRRKDRIRKRKVAPAAPIPRRVWLNRAERDEQIRMESIALFGPGFETAPPQTVTSAERAHQPGPGIACQNREEAPARITVSSRPQVERALNPWTRGFMPDLEYQPRGKGVPVDLREGSEEVELWIKEKQYQLSVTLRDIALAEARRREKKA